MKGENCSANSLHFPHSTWWALRLLAEVPYGENKTKCSAHSNKLAVNPSPEAKSHAENITSCSSQIYKRKRFVSRVFSCANRPLFIRRLVENSTLKLVFSNWNPEFFSWVPIDAKRRVPKTERKCREGEGGRERERNNILWSTNKTAANDIHAWPTSVWP